MPTDTVRVVDFSIDDLTVDRLNQLMRDINSFPKQITFITIPRATMIKMLETIIKYRQPRILI